MSQHPAPTPALAEARTPEARVVVDCERCGRSDGTPVTGWLRDEESADQLPPAFRELTFRFQRCSGCGLVYMRERPSPADLDVFYGDAYKCFESYDDRGRIMRALAGAVARGKLRQIEKLMPPGCDVLLDYGCGAGTWLDLIQGLGCRYRMIGMDVTEGPLEELRRRGIEAHCCDETTMFRHVERESVGVIHLFHVIEHLPDVGRTLRALHEALVPGGAVVGQTPNVASWGCRVFGDFWNQWHVPRHLVLFDHETLRALGRHPVGALGAGVVVPPARPRVPQHPRAALPAGDPRLHPGRAARVGLRAHLSHGFRAAQAVPLLTAAGAPATPGAPAPPSRAARRPR
jgi:2-polyprenyl-3-methyl-5-hydroxy-6-metoxy-1,4-benzoquinol methylase